MPTRQSTYGLPRFARDDDWVGGSLMAGHALLAMTFMVEISSLRGGSRPTWQSTYGLPRSARDAEKYEGLPLIR